LVRFQLYKPETVKTKLNRIQTGKNPSQTGKNRAKPVFDLKNQTKTGRFELVSVFLKKIRFDYFFI
jgi:hypothetical protein